MSSLPFIMGNKFFDKGVFMQLYNVLLFIDVILPRYITVVRLVTLIEVSKYP